MRTRRALMWLIAATLALVAVAGCTGEPSPNDEDTITVAFWDSDMRDLFGDQSSMYLVFLPLVARNSDGELEGGLPSDGSTRRTTEAGRFTSARVFGGTTEPR